MNYYINISLVQSIFPSKQKNTIPGDKKGEGKNGLFGAKRIENTGRDKDRF